jgi:raffinose/stachyose/melibiose transport system substrate-binding protein
MTFKMKKLPLAAGVLSTSLLFTAACSSESASENKSSGGDESDKVVIDIYQPKAETAAQLEALTAQYTKENPNVTFSIQTVGDGNDYTTSLKAKFAAGEQPDIFTNGGNKAAETWKAELEDLSDQPWVKDAYEGVLDPITMDGKIYGQPMNLEGYGFVYNKELFKKAGITELPKTISELEEAAKKLQDAGITAFGVGYAELWVLGTHGVNIPFAHQEDADAFIKGLNDGTAKMEGNEQLQQHLDLVDLTVKYGNKNPLTTDYNTQVAQFASGETAMMQQGNWTQPMIDQITPNMDIGILPMPLNDDAEAMDKLAIGVPEYWVVSNKVPEEDKQAAKDFLNWMVSSEEGKRALVEEFKYIPAFKSIEAEGIGALGEALLTYSKEGKTLSWEWTKYPDGTTKEFGAALQAYIGGQISKEEVLKSFDKSWAQLNK